jgi:methylmalonyl-CoA/ethylmalonyl-CoA epimerase
MEQENRMAGIRGISHIGIAVKSIEEQVPFYRDVLGAAYEGTEEVPDQKVRVAFFQAGNTRLELLEPTDPSSPIARFMEKRGEGIHHVAYHVDDVAGKIEQLKRAGIRMIDETPRPGAHHTRIAFIHPSSTHGVLTELCQEEPEHE